MELMSIKRGRYLGPRYFKHHCSNEGCAGALIAVGLYFWELSFFPPWGQYCGK